MSEKNNPFQEFIDKLDLEPPCKSKPASEQSSQKRHSFRRIELPSGRSIEVVRFYTHEQDTNGLHICPECDGQHVQPIEWKEAPEPNWEVTLHCPNCDWENEGVFTQDQVDHLEVVLDDGLTDMLRALRNLTEFLMEEEIERFTAALEHDDILPEDF